MGKKIFGFVLVMLVSTIQGGEKLKIKLKVFNLNTWGSSYFEDLPIPSNEEPYDVESIRHTLIEYMNASYPNPYLLPLLQILPNTTAIGLLNEARNKRERFDALCKHLKENSFDVIFLQEVWFKKDYRGIKKCTKKQYQITKFDKECGRLNPMTFLECSGLVTLVRKPKKLEQKMITLPKGSDFANLTDVTLYGEYFLTRKALVVDTKISGGKDWIRLINLHLTPYHLSKEENRELRTQQAQYVCKKVIKNNNQKKWKLAIVGMDMNDAPGNNSVYQTFLNCGFVDAYNPDQSDSANYPLTYGTIDNNWTSNETSFATLDYIMAMGKYQIMPKFKFTTVQDLKTPNNLSLSDHNSVSAKIKLAYFEN